MSRERGRSERQGRSGNRRAWGPPPSPYGLPGAGEGIAYFEDNQDDVRLTVTAKLVVRVTRPEILRRHAARRGRGSQAGRLRRVRLSRGYIREPGVRRCAVSEA